MSNSINEQSKDQAVPFFARFLEAQQAEQQNSETRKYPSDWEEAETRKYPSDWEEG